MPHVISTVEPPITPNLTTRDLLEQFERTGSPLPFEELMRRYGGMVFNVCYQVTRDKHDAEDAMQATFLTLAVRARQVRRIEYLGPWLQKVGRRVALDMSRSKRRRVAREQRHGEMERIRQADAPQLRSEGASQGVLLDELKQALRDELDKLPTKYRLPLILHYFGGLCPEEVAREMKLNASTLGVRLHRGRKMLAEAMTRRGFALSAAAVATMLGTLVSESVLDGVVATSSYAAAQVAAGASAPVGVTPDVFALASSAARGLMLSRVRSLAVLAVLLGGSVTGGASIAYRYLPHIDLQLRDVLRWIEPAWRSRPIVPTIETPRVRLGDASPEVRPSGAIASMPPSAPTPVTSGEVERAAWPQAAAPSVPRPEGSSPSAMPPPAPRGFSWTFPSNALVKSWPHAIVPTPSPVVPRRPATPLQAAAAGPTPRALEVSSSLWHRAGTLRTDTLTVDSSTGRAWMHLAGGEIVASRMTVGRSGSGAFMQTGGSLRVEGSLSLAAEPGSDATATLSAGSIAAGDLRVGVGGQAEVLQLGGEVRIAGIESATAGNPDTTIDRFAPSAGGSVALGVERTGVGHYSLRDGSLSADQLLVGVAGRGTYEQAGGRAQFNAVTVGVTETGSGIVQLSGGDLRLRSSELADSALKSAVVVGRDGAGVLKLGGDRDAFQLVERLPDARVPLVVRARDDGDGVIHGWGKVTLTGPFVQNGRVIADGFGRDRALDFTSVEFVANTIDNLPGGANGWFARDGGTLRLPPLRVVGDGDYTWGESPTDPELDLVNSLRLRLHDVSIGGSILVSLQSPQAGRGATGLPASSLLGLWELARGDVKFGSAELTLRYDDVALAMLGGDVSELALYGLDGSWQRIDSARLAVDAERSLLHAWLDQPYDGLALAAGGRPNALLAADNLPPALGWTPGTSADRSLTVVPEPTTGAMLLLGVAGAVLHRRRRPG